MVWDAVRVLGCCVFGFVRWWFAGLLMDPDMKKVTAVCIFGMVCYLIYISYFVFTWEDHANKEVTYTGVVVDVEYIKPGTMWRDPTTVVTFSDGRVVPLPYLVSGLVKGRVNTITCEATHQGRLLFVLAVRIQ